MRATGILLLLALATVPLLSSGCVEPSPAAQPTPPVSPAAGPFRLEHQWNISGPFSLSFRVHASPEATSCRVTVIAAIFMTGPGLAWRVDYKPEGNAISMGRTGARNELVTANAANMVDTGSILPHERGFLVRNFTYQWGPGPGHGSLTVTASFLHLLARPVVPSVQFRQDGPDAAELGHENSFMGLVECDGAFELVNIHASREVFAWDPQSNGAGASAAASKALVRASGSVTQEFQVKASSSRVNVVALIVACTGRLEVTSPKGSHERSFGATEAFVWTFEEGAGTYTVRFTQVGAHHDFSVLLIGGDPYDSLDAIPGGPPVGEAP